MTWQPADAVPEGMEELLEEIVINDDGSVTFIFRAKATFEDAPAPASRKILSSR